MDANNLKELIVTRRSVRGFLDKDIDKGTLIKIFKMAQHAPSNCNIQPWHVFLSSGQSLNRIKKKLLENFDNNINPNPDFSYPKDFMFNLDYLKRQVRCAEALYNSMGIARNDKAARRDAVRKNYEMYNAKRVCFIAMYEDFSETIALDIGIYIQSLMLSMMCFGVSSCAQATLRDYPDIIRDEFDMPPHMKILIGISFGYEDTSVDANKTRTTRSPIEESITMKD